MPNYLILTEKPSAAANFTKALGGKTGVFSDFTYKITNLRGHVMTLKDPEEMVAEDLKKQYKSWLVKHLPWNLEDFSWARTYIRQRNIRTGKIESTKKLIDELKKESKSGYDAIVIATDTDPSGEGELLAWEALDAIGWRGQVLRANFMDESVSGIQKAMHQLRNVSDKMADGEYVKGESRNRWDFASMQLTRIATTAAKKEGFKVVAREGRLKSVIVWRIYQQLAAIKNYIKTPYFEVKFKDPAGHIFGRVTPQGEVIPWRFATKEQAKVDFNNYHETEVINEKHQTRTQAPGKLLDLAGLASILAPRGFSSKEVLSTYQKMYEAQIVSYPRTEDKTVTPEQFNELLPLIDQIAGVVGVDKNLLTHHSPRKTHVKSQGAHGANRPGENVPQTTQSLAKFGSSGPAIYEVLAKNYLAMLAEDYVYDHVTANLKDYPEFKTAFNIPIKLNFKLVYDSQKAIKVEEGEEEESISGQLGPQAMPYLHEGANPKPQVPTTKWIMAFLEKHNVGTGATRVSTLSEMSRGTKAMLTEKRGKLGLTETGNVSAIMVKDTWIASPKITKRLFEMMDQVGRFEMTMVQVLDSATKVVEHDMPIMLDNAQTLETLLGKPKPSIKKPRKTSEKMTGIWQGQEITFAREWSGHVFTDEELQKLLTGSEVSFPAKSKRGKSYTAVGKMAKQTFKGNTFYGFKLNPKTKKA
ncbi:DNA topoisomerase [Leuconostoc mesenteroides]|jgi:DNA topoisomerase-3|uniref:Type IA DNA topoisomerase n=2 Tax=Leuconostoc mesenteroides TaxID=1245 RepID=A0A843Z0P7_LEUME|nr:DNA topoisomerase [Leuconostoc mesenteroides]MBZ1513746.1 type IA DNA topoisomerase [Leuconostoc mesenteroides]MBZ1517581.1 type IA DNA topoisomerase [Leuconostoc mesenteroides]MBZ1520190.1 type IA DNA topoisomerase [Leuconostoc mesenteroides]MBZ1521929.1 type IA DNA topoisomerase [Leuconostoc mesenteroides]MBZ1526246.1 type IA DNA topoisomerase [Leuconostoc mesenteroides]